MDCLLARENIGPYIDGELDSHTEASLLAHLRECSRCAKEAQRARNLVERLRSTDLSQQTAPSHMWSQIDQRLNAQEAPGESIKQISANTYRRQNKLLRFFRKPLAAAASIALFLGTATTIVVLTNRSAQTASAATVDYSVLLDGLAENVDAAVERFFKHYAAKPIELSEARSVAPTLDFALPEQLPGGFQREGIYQLRFGTMIGIAARYRRGDEPLVVFFHPPMDQTRMGVHHESSCHVAGREGQCVEVGSWQLVHFTDPTTCHCLLSKLPDEIAQAKVLAAVAPKFKR